YQADSSLQYSRARWYDTLTGRWLSMDPKGFAAGSANLYEYVGDNPTDATDPSGLELFVYGAANAKQIMKKLRGVGLAVHPLNLGKPAGGGTGLSDGVIGGMVNTFGPDVYLIQMDNPAGWRKYEKEWAAWREKQTDDLLTGSYDGLTHWGINRLIQTDPNTG